MLTAPQSAPDSPPHPERRYLIEGRDVRAAFAVDGRARRAHRSHSTPRDPHGRSGPGSWRGFHRPRLVASEHVGGWVWGARVS